MCSMPSNIFHFILFNSGLCEVDAESRAHSARVCFKFILMKITISDSLLSELQTQIHSHTSDLYRPAS